ncbi:glycosyltransferase family 2 protein [Olegusella massiliensis]|uniref:glycosyltransferase family 2 protein n=1 Tax=Olegusella massiliensis TaxID=1776381 RepID=UPI0040558E2A
MSQVLPKLIIVVPCYNESEVLPITAGMFKQEIETLISKNKIDADSHILFVDDGSKDDTWQLIEEFTHANPVFLGMSLSRNRGHQNALLAGLMEAKDMCDITISIDADGQDDITAMEKMLDEYLSGSEIVYGVRSDRRSDTFFKRTSAQSFYKLLSKLGVETVYNSADYRLMSSRALNSFAEFKEVNLFLRGMVPLVGYKYSIVTYERHERLAGSSHYPLKKMIALAIDGITSLSVQPITYITMLGFIISLLSFIAAIWAIVVACCGKSVSGWASMTVIICLLGGIQLISLGVIGEYIGKIYLETKSRPRFIIDKRTYQKANKSTH